MTSDESDDPVEGQLDVFDVLELVKKEGLKPLGDNADTKEVFLRGVETKLTVERGQNSSFWVVDEEGVRQHENAFYSQVECWAYIRGWETRAGWRRDR